MCKIAHVLYFCNGLPADILRVNKSNLMTTEWCLALWTGWIQRTRREQKTTINGKSYPLQNTLQTPQW